MFISWRFAVGEADGSVVFSGRAVGSDEPYQLYKIRPGSDAPVKITSGGDRDAWDPSYASGGEYLIYRSGTNFWKVREDGSGAKIKVPGSGLNRDYYPQVSSADRVAFVTYDQLQGNYLIWTVGIDGSDLTQFREGNFPTWSPDGSKIAFEYDNDIWIMNADGRQLTQLTATRDFGEYKPSFSPDGQKIVFVSNETDESSPRDFNIWTMRIDGTEKTQVTELPAWDSWPIWKGNGIYFLSGRAKGDHNVQRIWRISYD
jgi:Tol biopolymer transport system component